MARDPGGAASGDIAALGYFAIVTGLFFDLSGVRVGFAVPERLGKSDGAQRARLACSETPVPLYYFDVQDGVHDIAPTAEDLSDLDAARERAMGLLADVLRWSPASIWSGNDVRIEVLDAEKLVLFQLFAFASFSSAGLKVADSA